MIQILVIALLCVLILYVVYTYLPLDGALKKPIFTVLSILFLIWLIYALAQQGLFSGTLRLSQASLILPLSKHAIAG